MRMVVFFWGEKKGPIFFLRLYILLRINHCIERKKFKGKLHFLREKDDNYAALQE